MIFLSEGSVTNMFQKDIGMRIDKVSATHEVAEDLGNMPQNIY